jgi:hypothetical protein
MINGPLNYTPISTTLTDATQIKTEQADDGANQAFCLAQRKPEHRPERQRRQNGQRRIPGLASPVGSRLGPPGCDRLISKPHRQAAALAQARLLGGPGKRPASVV